MLIDSLTHILPKEISEEIDKYKNIDKTFNELFEQKTKIVQTKELIEEISKNNIDKAVVAGFGWQNDDLISITNKYIIKSKNNYPNHIIPFCTINIKSKKSEEELLDCINKGIKGIGELHFNYEENYEKNKIFKNILKIAHENNLPIIIHGSEPVGHKYNGKGINHPQNLYSLAKNNPDNIFIYSHFGGGLIFYEHMPEVKKVLRNVFYDCSAQPFLYNKSIFKMALSGSTLKKLLFATDFPLIDIKRCLNQISHLETEEKNHILSYNPISVFNL
tara:strand:- start:457 stop:1281 length:825 start_codon:yes stop_codon:yes gene_type:complete